MNKLNRLISIAPMMGYTDRHFRYFMRLLSRHSLLYTEMINCHHVIKEPARFLYFHPDETPVALQLGGNEPQALALASKIAEEYGYQEINLNVGCPSNRVQQGRFGAGLMKEANLVAECVAAMQKNVTIPVTVKTRLGVDQLDSYDFLFGFIDTVKVTCNTFIIHARKAWLKGLNPKQNRSLPPLDYQRVYQLKQHFPELEIIINGGITSLKDIEDHLSHVDGVMIGRLAYQNPWILSDVDNLFAKNQNKPITRVQVIRSYIRYMESELSAGVAVTRLIKPLLNLYHGVPGAKAWRNTLTTLPTFKIIDAAKLENLLCLAACN